MSTTFLGALPPKKRTRELKNPIIVTGLVTTAVANLEKCHGPAQILTILGTLYNALTKMVSLPPKKQQKYCQAINKVLQTGRATSKELEKIVGYLVWASYTEPFGRPFISAISAKITRATPETIIYIIGYIKWALQIWLSIIKKNAGISFKYVLNDLPHSQNNWFVDAATSWGIGGFAGSFYFAVPNEDLTSIFYLYEKCLNKSHFEIPEKSLPIAYIELIAALIGFSLFSSLAKNTIVSLFSDNTDVVAWLRKSRCS